MMYKLVAVLAAAAVCVTQVSAQCDSYIGRVTLLLDVSETSRTESTSPFASDPFQPKYLRWDILRDQTKQFADGLTRLTRPVDVQLGIISYSGSARVTQSLTTPADLSNRLANQASTGLIPDSVLTNNGDATGGSWTYTGLTQAQQLLSPVPSYRNILVVVSAQGSFNSNRQNQAYSAANALRSQGFEVFVVAVKPDSSVNFLDQQELQGVAQDINNNYRRIEYYNQLAAVLNSEIRDKRLCAAVRTTTPPPTTTTPDPNHPCARCRMYSGTYNAPHPETCSKFYNCRGIDSVTGDYVFDIFDCGPGTLFNDTDANCVWPQDFSCPAWGGQCTVGRVARFPHLCCGRYWQCDNGDVKEVVCPRGQVFNNGECRVVADNTCLQMTPCPGDKFTKCENFYAVPGNPCKYIQYDPIARKNVTMECGPFTGWNQELCTCGDIVSSCPVEEGVDVLNGNDGINCKANVHVSFDAVPLRAIDDRTRQDSGHMIRQNTVLVENGYAVFRGQEGVTNDIIFIPFYANRVFPKKLAIRIQFRFSDQARETEYVLVANDRCAECNATMRLIATRSSPSSNQWTFTFWVRDANRDEASVSATANINSNTEDTEVKVMIDGTKIGGTVSTSANFGQTNQVQMTGPDSTITAKVKETDCGFSIGQGRVGPSNSNRLVALDGSINDFKVYECDDLTDLA